MEQEADYKKMPELINNQELNNLVIQNYISKVFSDEKKFKTILQKRKPTFILYGSFILLGIIFPMLSMELFQILLGFLFWGFFGFLINSIILYVEYSVKKKMELTHTNLINVVNKELHLKSFSEINGNNEQIKENIDKILLFINIIQDSSYYTSDLDSIDTFREQIEAIRLNTTIKGIESNKVEKNFHTICFLLWKKHQDILDDVQKLSRNDIVPVKKMTKEELEENIRNKKEEFLKDFLIKN